PDAHLRADGSGRRRDLPRALAAAVFTGHPLERERREDKVLMALSARLGTRIRHHAVRQLSAHAKRSTHHAGHDGLSLGRMDDAALRHHLCAVTGRTGLPRLSVTGSHPWIALADAARHPFS